MMKSRCALLLLGVFLLAGCGGSESAEPRLLFGDARGIVQHTIGSGEERVLVAGPSSTHTLRDPTVSPDGKRVAYTYAPPLGRVNGVQDGGSDLWVAARDGSGPRALYTHARLTEAISSPRWLDDSTILAVDRYVNNPGQQGSGSTWALMRFDAETGAGTMALPGVLSFDISPDGTKIAYVLLESAAEQPLYIANIDGTNPQRLADTTSGIASFSSPRFSPDGTHVYVAAHEPLPGEQSRARLVSRRPITRTTNLHAELDLWVIDAAGGVPRQVAKLRVLEPGLVFDPAGDSVYVLAGGLFKVDLASGEVVTIEEGLSYGNLSWVED